MLHWYRRTGLGSHSEVPGSTLAHAVLGHNRLGVLSALGGMDINVKSENFGCCELPTRTSATRGWAM